MPKPIASGVVVTSAFLNDLTGVYIRRTNEIDVVSSITETDLLKDSGGTALSIAANAMSTDRTIRGRITGDFLQNSGGASGPPRFKLNLGATNLLDSGTGGAAALGVNAARSNMIIDFEIHNLNATNVQFASLTVRIPAAGTPTGATGVGQFVAGGTPTALLLVDMVTNGTVAVATSSAQNLTLTVINAANHASYSTRKKYAYVELM